MKNFVWVSWFAIFALQTEKLSCDISITVKRYAYL